MSNIILINQDKRKRAEDIFVLLGKNPKSEGDASLKERFTELLKEEGTDLKNKEDCVLSIYNKLGGATITQEEEIIRKSRAKKGKKFARVEKDDEKVEDEDDDD